jgi:methanogenic corrinoid protein MtbC1
MGVYKIKDIEVLTGIKAHTIRIWEKRYGILEPARTDTQIRTYTDKDLTDILSIAILNKKGIKISRIAEMSFDQIWSKVNEFHSSIEKDIHYESLLLAVLNLDELQFNSALNDLIIMYGLEETYSKYLTSFLDRIGLMWITGTIHAGQEHFMSNLIRQHIISETSKLPVPDAKNNTVLLFLPEREWHEISLLFYHYILRSHGVYSFYLGQSTPYPALLICVEKLQPKALVTSCLTAVDAKLIQNYFKELKKDIGNVDLYAGGAQILEHSKKLSGIVKTIRSNNDLLQMVNAT